ncbi:MAG TPA: hypothetical protein VE986_09985 [Hyphomicrobiales bacterium]|nr:hypothetical protein [Hyphomicrobiales bacterium]
MRLSPMKRYFSFGALAALVTCLVPFAANAFSINSLSAGAPVSAIGKICYGANCGPYPWRSHYRAGGYYGGYGPNYYSGGGYYSGAGIYSGYCNRDHCDHYPRGYYPGYFHGRAYSHYRWGSYHYGTYRAYYDD